MKRIGARKTTRSRRNWTAREPALDDLIQEFLVESNENLDRLDSELVKLQSDPKSTELLASIFRSIHSIKGACGFLGFNKLQGLAHAGESLLSKLREILIQDQATSVVWGMPGAIAAAGLADQIYPLGNIGPEIIRRVGSRRALTIRVSSVTSV